MKTKPSTLKLTLTAIFTSLIAVFTAWLFHIPIIIGANTAYLHFGDAFIFLAASILPTPYALISAAIGGGLADILCGAAVWAPFTAVIKLLIALCFTGKSQKIICKRNLLAFIPALIITVLGYYIAEALIYQNWIAPFLSIFGNVVQILGSGVIYILLAPALEKSGIKKLL